MTKLLAVAALAALASMGFATSLRMHTNVDDVFSAYLSTSDSALGTLIGTGDDWRVTHTLTATLDANQDYYLHLVGADAYQVADGFLADASLTGTGHKFVNGTASLLTNTTDWKVSRTGFGMGYEAVASRGANGVSPWGLQSGVASSAQWIWTGDNGFNESRYFSTKIQAVPEPSAFAALGLGALGLLRRNRKK